MEQVIFLTQRQKAILDDSDTDLNLLFENEVCNILSRESINAIESNTYVLLEKGMPLANMGFDRPLHDDRPIMALEDDSVQHFIEKARTCTWGAAAPAPGRLVVWIESDDCGDANSHIMLKLNLLTIVKAMANAMAFRDLKQTRQFELAVIQAAA